MRRMAERHMTYEAQHTPTELIELDLLEVKERIARFKELACQADRVVITIICCDSRVVLPDELVEVETDYGSEQVLFITIPTIGSGAPSRSRIRSVIDQLTNDWGVEPNRLSILVTQHGDSREITEQHQEDAHEIHISCGLRKVFLQELRTLTRLRQLLLAWSHRFKSQNGDKTLAPDRLSLDVLRQEVPDIMALVDKLHKATGKAGLRIPRRLLIRAAYRNNHSDMDLNELSVYERILGYLNDDEYQELRATCEVGYAAYDHQTKTLHFDNPHANLGFGESVVLASLPPRTDRFQDPDYCVISFGYQTVPLAVRQLLPHLCGQGSDLYQPPADNAFRTVASIPTVPTLLCAMAEAAYAVLHRVHPHEGDPNFNHLQKAVIICDNDEYVQVIDEMLSDPEFKEEYLPMFHALQPEGFLVVNLHLDDVEQAATLETCSW